MASGTGKVIAGTAALVGLYLIFGGEAKAAPGPDPGPPPKKDDVVPPKDDVVVDATGCLMSDVAAIATLAAVQSMLVKVGYNTGGIDGKCSPSTKAAISSFQGKNKLSQTSIVNMATYRALKGAVELKVQEDEYKAGYDYGYKQGRAGSSDVNVVIASAPKSTYLYAQGVNDGWSQGRFEYISAAGSPGASTSDYNKGVAAGKSDARASIASAKSAQALGMKPPYTGTTSGYNPSANSAWRQGYNDGWSDVINASGGWTSDGVYLYPPG